VRRVSLALLLALAACGCGSQERHEPQAAAVSPGGDANTPAAPAASAPAAPAPPGTANPAAPAAGAQPTRRDVTLFFERDDDDALGAETRPILLSDSIVDQAKQIVSELVTGPHDKGLLPTIPQETKVLGLYLDRAGTAYVDLSDEFVDKHPGGSSEELATVFSIVDSLTYNLPEVKRVRFLVVGEERDTLASHLDLRRAYVKDMSIVKMDEAR
jgi:spore germination protein GerM